MSAQRSLRLLVLGGTNFLGRALVEAALERRYQVTLFNRGQTHPELFPEVEKLRGDRSDDLSALDHRRWDAVIDVAVFYPRVAQLSVDALRDAVDRYLLVSAESVYADLSVPPSEDAPLEQLADPDDESDETYGESYGARKAACERVVLAGYGERATIVRPGVIVGPHDPTDRLSYWPKRIARGGRVLAPGSPDDPVQFIDVRDLALFMVRLLEDDQPGTFNTTGRIIPFGDLLDECRRVTRAEAEFVWVPTNALLAAGLDPWMGVPLWIGLPNFEGNRMPIERALAAGLTFRPLEETIRAALEDDTIPQHPYGLTPDREADLLAHLAPVD